MACPCTRTLQVVNLPDLASRMTSNKTTWLTHDGNIEERDAEIDLERARKAAEMLAKGGRVKTTGDKMFLQVDVVPTFV